MLPTAQKYGVFYVGGICMSVCDYLYTFESLDVASSMLVLSSRQVHLHGTRSSSYMKSSSQGQRHSSKRSQNPLFMK